MKNINSLLVKLVEQGLIGSASRSFLQDFFVSRMHLECDMEEPDIASAIKAVATTKFGSGLGLNDESLTGEFKLQALSLIINAAFFAAISEKVNSLEIGKIFFVFCWVHDATAKKLNGSPK